MQTRSMQCWELRFSEEEMLGYFAKIGLEYDEAGKRSDRADIPVTICFGLQIWQKKWQDFSDINFRLALAKGRG